MHSMSLTLEGSCIAFAISCLAWSSAWSSTTVGWVSSGRAGGAEALCSEGWFLGLNTISPATAASAIRDATPKFLILDAMISSPNGLKPSEGARSPKARWSAS